MSEVNTPAAVAPAAPTPTPTPIAPEVTSPVETPPAASSWVNTDGTLREGWKNNLVPEDFRGRKVYDAVGSDVPSLLRHIGHQDGLLGRQGKGVFPPGPSATKTEIDLFYSSIGRPEKPEGYDISIPGADEASVTEAKAFFHSIGLTAQQASALAKWDTQRMTNASKDLENNPEKYFQELLPKVEGIYKQRCEEDLRKRWGDAYDARMHLARRAVEEFTKPGDERDLLLSRVGNDPAVVDFLATIMDKSFSGGSSVNTSTGSPAVTSNIDQRIDEMMRDPNYMDGRTNPARHKYLVEEVFRLRQTKRGANI